MEIFTSSKFDRRYKKLIVALKLVAEEKEKLFLLNQFDARLDTHKLHGQDRNYWAYSVTRKIRIKFLFLPDNNILYLDIGTHDEVY